jgi:hypothetical protein
MDDAIRSAVGRSRGVQSRGEASFKVLRQSLGPSESLGLASSTNKGKGSVVG